MSGAFDRGKLLADAKAGLAKSLDKSLAWFPIDYLPALKWADGTPVDPQVVRWWVVLANKLKQPGGNALLDLWLARLAPGDASRFGLFVVRAWVEYDTNAVGEDEANAFAASHVDASLASNVAAVKRNPTYAEYYSTDRDVVFRQLKLSKLGNYLGSASDKQGPARARRAGGRRRRRADRARVLKDHGSRVSQAKAVLDMLAANPAPAAIQIVLATANRFKARTVQDHAAAAVAAIAERRGWTPRTRRPYDPLRRVRRGGAADDRLRGGARL